MICWLRIQWRSVPSGMPVIWLRVAATCRWLACLLRLSAGLREEVEEVSSISEICIIWQENAMPVLLLNLAHPAGRRCAG